MANPDIIAVILERVNQQTLEFLDSAVKVEEESGEYTEIPFKLNWQATTLEDIAKRHKVIDGESCLSLDRALQLLDTHLLQADTRGLTAEQISELANFSTDLRRQLQETSENLED